MHEAQMHERSCFATLTYDRENLPENGSLELEHWQKFAKRLRKAIGPFRFFHCGEYGTLNKRPHYHALLFGADFSSDRLPLKSQSELYTSPTLARIWGMGMVTIGKVEFSSAAYVARYTLKKQGRPDPTYLERFDSNTGECWTVRPEYVTMSRRPGIGSKWFERYAGDVFPADEVVHAGRRYKPPRYYDSKVPEDELIEIKDRRREVAAKFAADDTPARLEVREKVAEARLGQLERRL